MLETFSKSSTSLKLFACPQNVILSLINEGKIEDTNGEGLKLNNA